jgi:peptidoglycan/xylan/chitin deacetylase (PgdA/CDA1 family)
MIGYLIYIAAHFFTQFSTVAAPIQKTTPAPVDPLTKYIYLSFDDGPLPGTNNCITICEQQQVSATFFQIAFHQSRSNFGRNTFKRIASNPNLFLISNHSYSHAFYGDYINYYHQSDSSLADFLKAGKILQTNNNIARLPGNNAWNTSVIKRASGLVRPLVKKMDSVGFNVVGWDMEWRFNSSGRPIDAPEKMAAFADSLLLHNRTKTKNHLVILMHDHEFRASVDSAKLSKMIGLLKRHPNYQFRKLNTYPGLKKQD